MHQKRSLSILILLAAFVSAAARQARASVGPPQGTQANEAFAASYAANGVRNVSATSQKVSCYAPEVIYRDSLTPAQGYLDGGMSDWAAAGRRRG